MLSKRTVFPWSMSDFKPGEKVCAVGTHLAKAARNAAAPRLRDTKAEKRPNALAVRGGQLCRLISRPEIGQTLANEFSLTRKALNPIQS